MPTEMPPAPAPQGLDNAALTKEAAPPGYTTRVRALLGLPDRSTGIMPLTGPMLSMEFPYAGTDAVEDMSELPDAWLRPTDTQFELLESSEGKSLNKVESPMEGNAVDLSSAKPSPQGEGGRVLESAVLPTEEEPICEQTNLIIPGITKPHHSPALSTVELSRHSGEETSFPQVVVIQGDATPTGKLSQNLTPGVVSALVSVPIESSVSPNGQLQQVSQFNKQPPVITQKEFPLQANAVDLSSAKPSLDGSVQDSPEILGGMTTAWMQEVEQRKEQLPRGNQDKEKSQFQSPDVVTALVSAALDTPIISPVPIPLSTSEGEISRKASTAAVKLEVATLAIPSSTMHQAEAIVPLSNDNGMGMVPANTVDNPVPPGEDKARVKPEDLSMSVTQTSDLQSSGQDSPETLDGVTTLWKQEVEQRKEQLPRGNQDKEKSLLKSTHLSPFDVTQDRLLTEGEEAHVLESTALPLQAAAAKDDATPTGKLSQNLTPDVISRLVSVPLESSVSPNGQLQQVSQSNNQPPVVTRKELPFRAAVIPNEVIPAGLSNQNLSPEDVSALVSISIENAAVYPVEIPIAVSSEGDIKRKTSTAAMKPDVAIPALPSSTIPPAEARVPFSNDNSMRMVPGNSVVSLLPPGDGKAKLKPPGLSMTVSQALGAFALNPTAIAPLVPHSPYGDNAVNLSSAKPFPEGEGARVLKSMALPDRESLNSLARRETRSSLPLIHPVGTEPSIVPAEAIGFASAQSQSESSGQTKIGPQNPSSTAGQVLSSHTEVKRHSITLTPTLSQEERELNVASFPRASIQETYLPPSAPKNQPFVRPASVSKSMASDGSFPEPKQSGTAMQPSKAVAEQITQLQHALSDLTRQLNEQRARQEEKTFLPPPQTRFSNTPSAPPARSGHAFWERSYMNRLYRWSGR